MCIVSARAFECVRACDCGSVCMRRVCVCASVCVFCVCVCVCMCVCERERDRQRERQTETETSLPFYEVNFFVLFILFFCRVRKPIVCRFYFRAATHSTDQYALRLCRRVFKLVNSYTDKITDIYGYPTAEDVSTQAACSPATCRWFSVVRDMFVVTRRQLYGRWSSVVGGNVSGDLETDLRPLVLSGG